MQLATGDCEDSRTDEQLSAMEKRLYSLSAEYVDYHESTAATVVRREGRGQQDGALKAVKLVELPT